MFIKTITLEGFKSYAKRTEINGFDPSFNAITGLNGSGKSNILDAICFVLGLTNLSQIRAGNLQDLVYKSGQAGITKATVSIVFDNTSKEDSPIGYENFHELTITRQIVVGGKNKYLINGITATNTRVADMFRSVQLNVNNPHFLIMQGRITKVLNMKPPEILSLLEEAASTKNYENKRDSTLAVIQKKEGKLTEINTVLKEDIEPKLNKLRQNVEDYEKYKRVVNELDYLNKFIIAEEYTSLMKVLNNFEGEMTSCITQQEQETSKISMCDQMKKNKEQDIESLIEDRDNNHQPNLDEMNKQHKEMLKAEALLKNAFKRVNDAKKITQNEINNMQEKLTAENKNSEDIRKRIRKIQAQYDNMHKDVEEAKLELDQANKNMKDVNMGFYAVSESDEKKASLSEILRLANRAEADLKTEISNIKIKIRHYEKEKAEVEKKLSTMSKSGDVESQKKEHKKLINQKQEIDQELTNCGYSEEKYASLQDQLMGLRKEKRNMESRREEVLMENSYLDFNYRRPSEKFDDSSIFGVVARMVRLVDEEFSTAMEIIGGGRLYNVIIRDDEVGAALFNQDCLYRRTTLLPLNRMQPYVIPEHKFRAAVSAFGENNVWHPMKLLTFEESLRPAIGHVFGSCLIARDLETAKQIAFNARYGGVRCVTLEGDMFDPEGTLVGGSRPQLRRILQNADLLNRTLSKLTEIEDIMKNLVINIDKMESNRAKQEGLMKKLMQLTSKINELEINMMRNNFIQTQTQLDNINSELTNLNNNLNDKNVDLEEAIRKAKEAKQNFENSENVEAKAKKNAQVRLEKAESNLTLEEEKFKNVELEYEELNTKLQSNEEFEAEIERCIKDKNDELKQCEAKIEEENNKLTEHGSNIGELNKDIKMVEEEIKNLNQRIKELREEVKKLMENKNEAIIRLDNVKYAIECLQTNRKDSDKKIDKMIKKYAWIEDEKHLFGKPDSMFDFNSKNRTDIDSRIGQLEKEKQSLSRKVDLRGMNLLGPKQDEYKKLISRYNKVKQDKENLISVIENLDKMKDEVIQKAHEQVDKDFNKIFSTLLPGSQARLVPSAGKTLNDGLEFRIALGNVWKESLNELSGGQRSLVALSLVLALLRFKPAPLYILDEVDAALDISHTQNIGAIIRNQFSNSQFVVVSLKDGMFNNANVLFKTKFLEGISTITRHVNQQALQQRRQPMSEKN